ncbi:oxidoreductase [Streptomyces sp. NPDC058653]|uniref:oxidoreductase n=1 Tax=Streptomyces sp. NPDC058653 TaxID=3346576 RepID=UPI0036475A1B
MTEWTERDIPDQSGRVAVVTGANSGLGLVTATELARAGAHVVMAVRNTAAGERASEGIRRSLPNAEVQVRQLDLASLESVRAFAKGMCDDFPSIDLLVNNAAVLHMGEPRTTEDGFEAIFGVAVLGHFALTGLLLDNIRRAGASRVLSVSSVFHKKARLDPNDLMSRDDFTARRAYGRSKLANTAFALELDSRLREAGSAVVSVVAHPGICRTNFSPRAFEDAGVVARTIDRTTQLAFQSAERGVRPLLYAATAPGVRGGQFYGPSGFREIRGKVVEVEANAQAGDPAFRKELWSAAERLTGVSYL